MGRCGACFSATARFVLYAVVFGSTTATLWGLVGSQTKNSSCWLGGSSCILFGHVAANTTRCGVSQLHIATAGPAASCQFIIFFGAAQLIAIVGLFILGVIVACKRKDGHSDDTWRRVGRFVELVTVALLVLCSFAAALIVSIGLATFCNQMSKHWRSEPSNLVANSSISDRSCSSMYLHQDVEVSFNVTGRSLYSSSHTDVKFYHYIYVAQIATWAGFLVWGAHLVISIVAYRRRSSTEDLPYTLRPTDSLSSLDDDLLT